MIDNDCRLESFGASNTGECICRVKLDGDSILIEYEDDDGLVAYRGQTHGPGHYKLTCPQRRGEATLHRMPGSDVLEGFWREGAGRGMWRIYLSL